MHRPQCIAACRLYQCNVCGEGGEYESLVLDCPLFKHARIVLDSWEAVHQSADAFAPVGHLHPVAYHLEPKRLTRKAPPGVTPAATPLCMESLKDPLVTRHLESERLTSTGTFPPVTPAATPICVDLPREKLHSNSHAPLDPQTTARCRVPEQSSSKDLDLPAVVKTASIHCAPDNVWAGAVVVEVPRQALRFIADEATDTGTGTQSGETARHSVPSMASMASRQSMPAWSAHAQVQCGSCYVRAVCCPMQQAEGLASGKDTADALDFALAAIQQGQSLPDVCKHLLMRTCRSMIRYS